MVSPWLSALLGAGLGAGYGLAAFAMNRFALRHEKQRFLALFVGGMFLRMVGMLAAVGGVAAFVAVRPAAFAVPLVLFLVGALAGEVYALHRHANLT